MVVFMIVGKTEPLFEADIGAGNDELSYLHQFILHSSLDMLQSTMWTNSSTFLRVIDRFNALQISAYVTPGGMTLLLLHNGKPEDAVRAFFTEAHDTYAKHMLNPFSTYDAPIISPHFDLNIRQLARKHLST